MDEQVVLKLTRLMNCLVSHEAKDDLYGRFDDEELIESMNGLTEDLADIGVKWWVENSSKVDAVINQFKGSLESVSLQENLDMTSLLDRFNKSTWSDFIRESFYVASDLLEADIDTPDIKDYLRYAIEMSLSYSGDDSDINLETLEKYEPIFEAWWRSYEPFRLFESVYQDTQEGQKLVNHALTSREYS